MLTGQLGLSTLEARPWSRCEADVPPAQAGCSWEPVTPGPGPGARGGGGRNRGSVHRRLPWGSVCPLSMAGRGHGSRCQEAREQERGLGVRETAASRALSRGRTGSCPEGSHEGPAVPAVFRASNAGVQALCLLQGALLRLLLEQSLLT